MREAEVLDDNVHGRIGERAIEPGYATVLDPIGGYPLRGSDDLDRVGLIREMTPIIALAPLSSRYAGTIIRQPRWLDDVEHPDAPKATPDSDRRFATHAGLTVD